MRTVKWSIRDDGNSTWCKHYYGDYIVFVTDCDGDLVEWEIWRRKDYAELGRALKLAEERDHDGTTRLPKPLIKGEVSCGYDDLAIGQAIAIEALDALIRDREALAAERRAVGKSGD
jgi:hypothetical protein